MGSKFAFTWLWVLLTVIGAVNVGALTYRKVKRMNREPWGMDANSWTFMIVGVVVGILGFIGAGLFRLLGFK